MNYQKLQKILKDSRCNFCDGSGMTFSSLTFSSTRVCTICEGDGFAWKYSKEKDLLTFVGDVEIIRG